MAAETNYGETLLAAGGYTFLGTSLISGISAILSSEYQADVLEYQAKYDAVIADIEIANRKREFKKLIGEQRTKTAAAGIMPDMATPLELQVEAEILHEIDIQLIKSAAGMRNIQLQAQADFTRALGYAQFGKTMGQGAATGLGIGMYLQSRKPEISSSSLLTPRQKKLGV